MITWLKRVISIRLYTTLDQVSSKSNFIHCPVRKYLGNHQAQVNQEDDHKFKLLEA